MRTPVVSTSKGCEGIEHEGAFLVADTPAAFKAALIALLDDPSESARRAALGRAAYDRTYSLAANASRLDAAIEAAGRAKAAA